MHGYKAHVATDEGAGLVRGVEVTTANVHDAAELEAVLPPEPGEVYGDSAFAGGPAERLIIGPAAARRARSWTGTWGRGPEALARLEAHNAAVRRVRCRIEKVFGTWKRCYGLRRMRWLGLAKAGLQVRLAAMAYNLRRSWRLLVSAPGVVPARCRPPRPAVPRGGRVSARRRAHRATNRGNDAEHRRSSARKHLPRTGLLIPRLMNCSFICVGVVCRGVERGRFM